MLRPPGQGDHDAPPDEPHVVTRLLHQAQAGDLAARDVLLSRIGVELRQLAHKHLGGRRSVDYTQTTALLDEVFMELVHDSGARWENRGHFLCFAATALRRMMVDDARRRLAQKRGGGIPAISISQVLYQESEAQPAEADDVELAALSDALERFEAKQHNRLRSQIVQLRFFAGLSIEETASALALSTATIKREWNFARAWLRRELRPSGHGN